MRVLHLIKSLDIGGIETMALDFCNNAHKEGIETHLFCMGGGTMEKAFENSPAIFHKKRKMPLTNELIDPLLVRHLRKYIIDNSIDVVHAHFADEGLHALAALRGLQHPIMIQGFAVDFSINRHRDNLKFRFIAQHAGGCITLSRTLLDQFSAYNISPTGYAGNVHNGIDPARVTRGNPVLLKQELGLAPDTILGGMVGNFYNNVRDQLTVCKGLAIAMQKNKDFHFVFAGGSTNQWIKKNVDYYKQCTDFCAAQGLSDRIHFLGLRADLPDILAGLDFYVHATNHDTFGMAPVEAMFNHLPVIVNDHPVFRETSRNGEGMILFEDKNEQDLSNKIMTIVQDEDLRTTTGQQHFAYANEHFHIGVHIRNMKVAYQKCREYQHG